MASGPRVSISPVNFNSYPNGGGWSVFPASPSAGYDTGSPGGTFTAWSSTLGVMIPNNGMVILYYWCGATAAGGYQVLAGEVLGTIGQPLPATAEAGSIAANSSGYLGPWSVETYNQTQPANISYSGAINTTALTAAATGCVVVDFTTTTTLSVRAYQLIPAIP